MEQKIVAPFLVAFLATLVATPLMIVFARKFKIIDDPKTHKHPAILHKKPIPRGGGVPIFLGILIATIIFLPKTDITWLILAGAFLAVFIGTLDDKFDLSPYIRLISNFIIAGLVVIVGGVGIAFITNPLGGVLFFDKLVFLSLPVVSIVFAMLWIVWTMNMLNWSKGVDGQMPGIAAISAIVIGALSLRFSPIDEQNLLTTQLCFVTAGAALGFLPFNFYKAKIFPGYGATVLGFLLGTTSILSGAKVATALLVMGVPMIDGFFTILRRILSGKSPFFGDRRHFHHILLDLGLGQRTIAIFYWVFSGVLGLIALSLSSQAKFFALLGLFLAVSGILIWLHFFTAKPTDEDNY